MTNENAAAKYDLVLERTFDAPVETVWQAWTDPAQLAAWWGPKHFTNPVCQVDVRPGGKIYIAMRAPDGNVYPMSGTFEEVVKGERLVFKSAALDAEGKPMFEIYNSVTFADAGGKTALKLEARVLNMTSADAAKYLDGMRAGWSQSLDKLDAFVTSEDAQ